MGRSSPSGERHFMKTEQHVQRHGVHERAWLLGKWGEV